MSIAQTILSVFPPTVSTVSTFVPIDEGETVGIALPQELSGACLRRKLEFIAGRHSAREALRRLGCNEWEAATQIGPGRSPIWPAGYVGSISHSSGIAAASVARATEMLSIGLDIETVLDSDTATNISTLIGVEEEFNEIMRRGSVSFEQAATVLFSCKEAVFKCVYPLLRRHVEFDEVKIQLVDFPVMLKNGLAMCISAAPTVPRILGHCACYSDLVASGFWIPQGPNGSCDEASFSRHAAS